MTLPLRDYLAQRRADIQAGIKAFRAELAEIDAAERALEDAVNAPARPRKERGQGGTGKKTLKELAVEVLWAHPEGLEASAILGEFAEKLGLTVRRESLSPQLSRLGQEGLLEREGLLWKIAHRLREQRPPPNEEAPDSYELSSASNSECSTKPEEKF